MKQLKIQYISDLHLEHYKIYTEEQLNPLQWIEPDPEAELLVLAGDIGNPTRASYGLFLQWCAANWPQVVVVAGNHEFYQAQERGAPTSREEVLALIRSIVSHLPNVHLLDREVFMLRPGLHVLGCTLWSYIPEDMREEAAWGLNDFRLIPGASTGAYVAWHERDLAWLTAKLLLIKNAGEEAIVVTHHVPTSQLISPIYAGHPLNCCFVTDLEELIKETEPAAWICGHTHQAASATIRGATGKETALAINPRGYPGERVNVRNRRAVLDLGSHPTS